MVSPVIADIAFVTRRSFLAGRRSALLLAGLTIVMALLPAAQVAATAQLIIRLQSDAPAEALALPVLVVVAAVALATPLAGVAAAIGERTMLFTEVRLQGELAGAMVRLRPSQLADPAVSAEIEQHTNAIVDDVSHVYVRAVAGAGSVIAAIGVVVTLALMSPLAALLVVVAAVPVALSGKYVSRAVQRMMVLLGKIYQRDRYLRDTLVRQRSATELASLGTTDRLAAMVVDHQHRVHDAREITIRAQIRVQLFVGLCSVVLLGAAVVAIIVGRNQAPDAVAGIYGVIAAMAATAAGSVSLADLVRFLPRTRAVRLFLASVPPTEPQRVAAGAQEIVVSNLRHRYAGREVDALAGVSFTARRGEMIALVGVNGAGKTTAVHGLLGLIEPTAGTVTVDGRERTELGEAAWLGQFGLLTQEFGRYEFTVRDTVALGRPGPVTDDEIWAALEGAHAAELVRAMPNGLDTQLGEQWGGVGVSGGQWQRLALARIHLRRAPIWILDEPTSAIDAEAEQEIFAELGRSRADRITIVVSHRAWTLRAMDRIHVFDQGRIVESGTYEELVGAGGRFAEIFAEQA